MFREVWKDVLGYEGYMVSNLGRVKSLNYHRTGKEKILRPGKDKKGYLQIGLWKDGKVKYFRVHRLVWIAFNGPIPEEMQINHNDEVKTNNNLENLNLMTQKANINWGTHNRRVAKALSKMIEQHTLDSTHICTWFSAMGIHRELGYSLGNIWSCCNGMRKTAYGFVWKYAE